MNNKKVLLFSFAALLSGSTLMAQWKTTGNALTNTGKLGSTNAQDVQFISNNVVNGTLNKNGRWGFGVAIPSAKVQINSAADEDAFRVQVGGNTKLVLAKNGGLTVGANVITPPAIGLFVQGNTGLGTSEPLSKLHIKIGSSGTTPFSLSTITTENSTSNYISLLAPNTAETGILFGHNKNNISGGIIYNSTFFSPAKSGLQFRTGGNIPRMEIDSTGLVNIGPGSNNDYRVRIDHGGAFGFDVANSSKGTDWEFFSGQSALNLFGNGFIKGSFDLNSGAYNAISDERLKTNIRLMPAVLEKVKQLKPSVYQFKDARNKTDYEGFIAQDVLKIFPSLVMHNVEKEHHLDIYTLNYSGFGVIAIKAIQELVKINEEKDAKMNELQKQIDELKAVVFKGAQGNAVANAKINITLTDAVLEQNAPNPFTNITTIRYAIPQKFATAQLVIHDNSGKIVKQVKIADGGNGAVSIDPSALSSGTYTYSLIVDGKIIGTKQMQFLR